MKFIYLNFIAVFFALFFSSPDLYAENWPQFRGPNASGVSTETKPLPTEIGPGKHLLWKIPIGIGHSSPVVYGNRVFLTEYRDKKLFTFAVDTRTGKRDWEHESEYDTLEQYHRVGNPATPSVAADDDVVVSFFGSCGMNCFSHDGTLLWHLPMGPFNDQYGSTGSPVLAGNRILTIQDHDTGSYLAALDKRTGKELWRMERPNFRRNYGSPVIWNSDGKQQVVVVGTAHVMGYDVATGENLWAIRGVCRVVSNTPVAGSDGNLYVASTGGGDTPPQPAFDDVLKQSDQNTNRLLEKEELPKSLIKNFFTQFDRDANGSLNETEYESIREIFRISKSQALAVKPGGKGDISESHVLWSNTRNIPRNGSPLFYKGHLYFAKDGGVLTSLDCKTGQVVKQGRLAGSGKYYSSPVVGDGKIYVCDDRGSLSVLSAEGKWKQLHSARFDEDVYATPAIAEGRVFLRTGKSLYCFGLK